MPQQETQHATSRLSGLPAPVPDLGESHQVVQTQGGAKVGLQLYLLSNTITNK